MKSCLNLCLEFKAEADLHSERKRIVKPINYSYARVRRDSIHIKLETIEHLKHSVNSLNRRIGPEDLTEDEISEAVAVLSDAEADNQTGQDPKQSNTVDQSTTIASGI